MSKLRTFTMLALVAILSLWALTVITPALAQDTVPQTTVTVQPTEAPPVVVVAQPPVTTPQNDLWTVAMTIGVLVLVVFEVVKAVARHEPVAAMDTGIIDRLSVFQDNREIMDRLERAYQTAGRQQQTALDTVAQAFRFISPLTPGIRADDKFAEVLADIQTPGAATSPPVDSSQG